MTLRDGARARIRPLASGDAPGLAALYASLAMEDLRFYGPALQGKARARELAAAADDPRLVALVLEGGDGLAGYAWYRWKDDADEQSHFGIAVARPWQGRGVGAVLMARLLEIARTVGPPLMRLTVQLANARALALYTRMGFQVVREQLCTRSPGSPWAPEPEYVMELRVR